VIVDGNTEITSKGKPVAARGGGDFVGEIALLEDTKRTATVTAQTPLRVFVLTRQDFRHLVRNNPSVEQKVMRALARRVVELSADPTVA
jgi:CRP-like cAMP-binding protein